MICATQQSCRVRGPSTPIRTEPGRRRPVPREARMPAPKRLATSCSVSPMRPSQWARQSECSPLPTLVHSPFQATDTVLVVQAEGMTHTSPGQSPGSRFMAQEIPAQAIGLLHRIDLGKSTGKGHAEPRSSQPVNRAFSAQRNSCAFSPGLTPWAGMRDAFGVGDGRRRTWEIACPRFASSHFQTNVALGSVSFTESHWPNLYNPGPLDGLRAR